MPIFNFSASESSPSTRIVVSQDGTRIWADCCGVKNRILVVFIHGFAYTALVWQKQFSDKMLSKNLYMVRYEMRGHGRSDHLTQAEAYSGERSAEDFMAVCKAFSLVKPFVCAWSFGSFVPVDVVQSFGPDVIAGVIYPGGPGLTPELMPQFVLPFLAEFIALLTKDADQVNAAANMFVDSCFSDPKTALPFENRLQWIAGFLSQSTDVRRFLLYGSRSSKRWEEEFTHKAHLLIQGTADRHSDTQKLVPIAKQTLSNLEVKILEGVGHAVAWEVPDKHNKYLLSFVRKHYRSS